MNNNTNNSGLEASGVLTLIFVVLKLLKVIDWSWWWVLSPIWIDLGVPLLILAGVAIYITYKEKRGK